MKSLGGLRARKCLNWGTLLKVPPKSCLTAAQSEVIWAVELSAVVLTALKLLSSTLHLFKAAISQFLDSESSCKKGDAACLVGGFPG